MANYLVKPRHKNGYYAPSIIIIDVKDASAAEIRAKKESRLSDFSQWDFTTNRLLKPTSVSGKLLSFKKNKENEKD
jgi:hypothetical protein